MMNFTTWSNVSCAGYRCNKYGTGIRLHAYHASVIRCRCSPVFLTFSYSWAAGSTLGSVLYIHLFRFVDSIYAALLVVACSSTPLIVSRGGLTMIFGENIHICSHAWP